MRQHYLENCLKILFYNIEPCVSRSSRRVGISWGYLGCFFNTSNSSVTIDCDLASQMFRSPLVSNTVERFTFLRQQQHNTSFWLRNCAFSIIIFVLLTICFVTSITYWQSFAFCISICKLKWMHYFNNMVSYRRERERERSFEY